MPCYFDNHKNYDIAVEYFYHDNIYARHLLETLLFPEKAENRSIPPADLALANHITQQKIQNIQKLDTILNCSQKGKVALTFR